MVHFILLKCNFCSVIKGKRSNPFISICRLQNGRLFFLFFNFDGCLGVLLANNS